MGGSILARADRLSLGNGMELRLLSAHELLEARREARKLTRSRLEQPLCSHACLLARALRAEGEESPFFQDGRQVLLALTAEEIEVLCARWDRFRRENIPNLEETVESGVNVNFDLPER